MATADGELTVGPATPDDIAGIRRVAAATGVFSLADRGVVDELLDDFERLGEASGYYFLVARRGTEAVGFACFGPTPLTQGTYDLYWIAAAQDVHGQGVGSALMRRVDAEMRERGARLLLIETESAPAYAAARRLYERHGWTVDARVHDFYAPGSDLLIYAKRYE